jgi:uncharacterized protein
MPWPRHRQDAAAQAADHELVAGMHVIQAEVARRRAAGRSGMMLRTEMGANEGMLFVNEQAACAASGCATR